MYCMRPQINLLLQPRGSRLSRPNSPGLLRTTATEQVAPFSQRQFIQKPGSIPVRFLGKVRVVKNHLEVRSRAHVSSLSRRVVHHNKTWMWLNIHCKLVGMSPDQVTYGTLYTTINRLHATVPRQEKQDARLSRAHACGNELSIIYNVE